MSEDKTVDSFFHRFLAEQNGLRLPITLSSTNKKMDEIILIEKDKVKKEKYDAQFESVETTSIQVKKNSNDINTLIDELIYGEGEIESSEQENICNYTQENESNLNGNYGEGDIFGHIKSLDDKNIIYSDDFTLNSFDVKKETIENSDDEDEDEDIKLIFDSQRLLDYFR